MITTLTEWKARLQPGVQIKQIHNGSEGDCSHIFTVERVQSNAIRLTPRRGRIDFPKRDEIEFTEYGWIRLEKGRKLAEYVWVD